MSALKQVLFAATFAILALGAFGAHAQGVSLDGLLGTAETVVEEAISREAETSNEANAEPQVVEPTNPDALASYVADFEAWEAVAVRAESSVAGSIGSNFALEKLRSELVDWRATFTDIQSVNAARITTVRSQIAALGTAPDTGEASAIEARRSVLEAQLAELRAPRVLANEAYARSDGLIGEIDTILRARQTNELATRGAAPVNPANWPPAISAVQVGAAALLAETTGLLTSKVANGTIWRAIPLAMAMVVAGFILLLRGRIWGEKVWQLLSRRIGRAKPILHFLITAAEIIVPLTGLILISYGLLNTDLFGFRGSSIVQQIPIAGTYVLVSRWLSLQYFDQTTFEMPVNFTPDEQRRGRSLVRGLGWSLAIGAMVFALIGSVDQTGTVGAMLIFPLVLVIGWLLFWVGNLLFQHRKEETGDSGVLRTFLGLIGRLSMFVACIAPLLAMLGYSAAFQSLLLPTVKSLALFGALLLVHFLATELYNALRRDPAEEKNATESEGLASVAVGFLIILLSFPFFALIWGASADDLFEVWTRFREGFSIGETKISPTDLLTFVVVFAIGYMITRLVQNALRVTVLPKTRLDIGGRNAIVSGVGYTGIFLAALIAITMAGIDLSSLAIVAGALSVGIGFGLQNIVSNFVAGIILLIERPISEGDLIEVGSQTGFVRAISVRSTRIETFDRTDVIVPNADLVSTQVTNWTRTSAVGRVIVPVGVAYGTDPNRITEILREIAEEHPMVLLDPGPSVVFTGFGADSLDFEIRAIIRDVNFKLQTLSEMNLEINTRFVAEGIEIPFAQRDLWIRNPEALRPEPEKQTPKKAKSKKTADKAKPSDPTEDTGDQDAAGDDI